MTRRTSLLAAAALVGCATSYDVLPLCGGASAASGSGTLARSSRPTTDCRISDEVEQYERLLAFEVLRRSQWQFPAGVPLHVDIDANGRPGRVCVGDASSPPSWSTRDRVASSLRHLRAVGPVPPCLAGTTLDLTSALVTGSVSDPFRYPAGMVSCPVPPEKSCTRELNVVCGYDRDGRGRDYRNACFACREEGVVGYLDFECR